MIFQKLSLSLSLSIYIYIYLCIAKVTNILQIKIMCLFPWRCAGRGPGLHRGVQPVTDGTDTHIAASARHSGSSQPSLKSHSTEGQSGHDSGAISVSFAPTLLCNKQERESLSDCQSESDSRLGFGAITFHPLTQFLGLASTPSGGPSAPAASVDAGAPRPAHTCTVGGVVAMGVSD